jgi:hypothetical protein
MAMVALRRTLKRIALLLLPLTPITSARADDAIRPEEFDELETTRAAVASELQLMAADLLDEQIFAWKSSPLFIAETNVVLAGVTVPLGTGAGLSAWLENHAAELFIKNPDTRMRLVHCPDCTALTTYSNPKGTVMARGLQIHELLAKTGADKRAQHAIFFDFEAEGSQLVLRTRVTEVRENLPIIYARTITNSTASAALLRAPTELKSAVDARREYLEILREKPLFSFPLRVEIQNFAESDDSYSYSYSDPDGKPQYGGTLTPPPLVWFTAGAEAAFSQARAWTAEFNVGFTNQINSHDGWLVGGRFSRLISGSARSLTRPDLYLVLGGSVISLRGSTAAAFRKDPQSMSDWMDDKKRDQSRSSFANYRFALESRVKNRVSATLFLEWIPSLENSTSFGDYLDFGLGEFQIAGMGVGFWF